MAASPKIVQLPADRIHRVPAGPRFRKRDTCRDAAAPKRKDDWSLTKPVKGGLFRTFFRLLQIVAVLGYVSLQYLFTTIWIGSRHKRTARRAALLKSIFEILGGAYIKIGQQLSMRRDLLRAEYCDALRDLLDNVKEFPFRHAREAIEEQTGCCLERVFPKFNQTPIGKASIGCVYEAWLRDRHKPELVRVAVKVRRPGIVELFAADLRALDWVLKSLEYLTIIREGFSGTFRAQLKEILFDEVDFTIEARFQELFRRQYKKAKDYRVTAPKVYHRYCGKAVMVSEFVDAIPFESVTSAVEQGDEEYLEYLRSLGIHPRRLARRLIRYNFHAFFESPFFHGDPHPGNIFVLPKNRLVFIDFGACGTFSKRDRNMMWQLHHFHARRDIRGMVECVIALMEPLPPIEIDDFRRKLEKQYSDGYYALLSKHSDWRDRTSYRLWVALYELVREYQIPIPLNMMRMIRATLLYDTIAAQLDNGIDVFKEFRKYEREVEMRLKRQLFRDAARQALCGPDLHWYLSFHRVWGVAQTALFRIEKFLSEPGFSFAAISSKVYYAIMSTAQWLISVGTISLVAVTFLFLKYRIGVAHAVRQGNTLSTVVEGSDKVNFWDTAGYFLVPTHWPDFVHSAQSTMTIFFVVVTLITISYLNALRLRFSDPDVEA